MEALRAWMLLFVDYIAAKQIIAPVLNALVGDPKKVFEASYSQIWEAIRALVKRAIKSGDIRKDLDPIDLLRALIGVANVSTSPDWQQSARRLVEILILGARPIEMRIMPSRPDRLKTRLLAALRWQRAAWPGRARLNRTRCCPAQGEVPASHYQRRK